MFVIVPAISWPVDVTVEDKVLNCLWFWALVFVAHTLVQKEVIFDVLANVDWGIIICNFEVSTMLV